MFQSLKQRQLTIKTNSVTISKGKTSTKLLAFIRIRYSKPYKVAWGTGQSFCHNDVHIFYAVSRFIDITIQQQSRVIFQTQFLLLPDNTWNVS